MHCLSSEIVSLTWMLLTDEEPEPGCLDKPVEMFHIAEHFCLGQRRLHVFGRDSSIRPGKPHQTITAGQTLAKLKIPIFTVRVNSI
jgi:hypothetical protein